MSKAGIYRIRNTKNDKVYIGQTSNLDARWRTHKHRLRRKTHANAHLQSSWNLYGESAFVFEILEHCALEDLFLREEAHLDAVTPAQRFNLGPAGASPTLGVAQKPSTKLRHSRSKGGRSFVAENIVTKVITPFEHAGQAVEQGFSAAHVYGCLQGVRKTHRGHTFRYNDDAPPQQHVSKNRQANSKSRPVICTAPDGVEQVFPYVGAVRAQGFNPAAVFGCLAGLCAQHKGCFWRYADGEPHRASEARNSGPRPAGGSRPVQGVHVASGVVKTFSHIAAAAQATGVKAPNINAVCHGRGSAKTAGGFQWSFVQ